MKLVLLAGLDGTGQLFQPLLESLPSSIKPEVISYPTDIFLNYVELESYVQKQCPKEEPFVLLAESFSGPIAIQLAATKPVNLLALILCATFISNPMPSPQRFVQLFCRSAIFKIQTPHFLARHFLLGKDSSKEDFDKFSDVIRSVSPDVLRLRVKQVLSVDARDALLKCNVPILYLLARNDNLVGRKKIKEMLELKPDIKVAEVDAPHFLLQRKPIEASKLIDNFLESLKG